MPLLFLSATFLVGIFLSSAWHVTLPVHLLGSVLGLAGLLASRWVPLFRMASLCILAFSAGLWRFESANSERSESAWTAMSLQRTAEVRGVVDAPPETREMGQNVRLSVQQIRAGDRWEEMRGAVLLFANVAPRLDYGDLIEVAGRLEEPPNFDGFDYREYLSRQGIRYVMQRPHIKVVGHGNGPAPLLWINGVRARLLQVLGSTLPEPEASLAQGILLGARSSIPRSLLNSFSTTGTTHILAISGYNITVIAAILATVAMRVVGRNRATYVAVAGIAFYSILADASPSVMRATLMGSLVIIAYRIGRQSFVLNALAVSAALLVAVQPLWLWDVGFQLSFLATIGLAFASRPLADLLSRGILRVRLFAKPLLKGITNFLVDGLAITLAATIYTMPLIALNFHTVSIISPVANLFAVPVLPLIIAGAAAVSTTGLIALPLGQIAAYLAWPFLAYLVGVVDFFARFPGSSAPAPLLDPTLVWTYYTALGGITLAIHLGPRGLEEVWLRLKEETLSTTQTASRMVASLPAKASLLSLALIAFVAWAAVFSLPDKSLQVTFLDVGQGDSILVRTPDNRKLLVDGGPSPQRLLNQLGRSIPFWDRKIDVMILTHPDDDHLAGFLGALESYQVGLVLEGSRSRTTSTYLSWRAAIEERKIRHQVLGSGQRLRMGRLEVDIIHAPLDSPYDTAKRSNESLILRLQMENVSFLLTGDTPAESQAQFLDDETDLKSTVLKVPHHGARDALDERFLDAIDPTLAVISVGTENSFGHPAPETLALLGGIRTLRTDTEGPIVVATDGKRLWIKTGR